jgi:hypothetical protein
MLRAEKINFCSHIKRTKISKLNTKESKSCWSRLWITLYTWMDHKIARDAKKETRVYDVKVSYHPLLLHIPGTAVQELRSEQNWNWILPFTRNLYGILQSTNPVCYATRLLCIFYVLLVICSIQSQLGHIVTRIGHFDVSLLLNVCYSVHITK